MSKDLAPSKCWFDTLSEIMKDEFIGLNLTQEIGVKLIRDNTVTSYFLKIFTKKN